MDVAIDSKRGFLDRAEALGETEPNFARFLTATINAARSSPGSTIGKPGNAVICTRWRTTQPSLLLSPVI